MESLTKKRKKAKWKIRESSPGPPPEAVTRDDFPEIFNINDGTEEIIDNAEISKSIDLNEINIKIEVNESEAIMNLGEINVDDQNIKVDKPVLEEPLKNFGEVNESEAIMNLGEINVDDQNIKVDKPVLEEPLKNFGDPMMEDMIVEDANEVIIDDLDKPIVDQRIKIVSSVLGEVSYKVEPRQWDDEKVKEKNMSKIEFVLDQDVDSKRLIKDNVCVEENPGFTSIKAKIEKVTQQSNLLRLATKIPSKIFPNVLSSTISVDDLVSESIGNIGPYFNHDDDTATQMENIDSCCGSSVHPEPMVEANFVWEPTKEEFESEEQSKIIDEDEERTHAEFLRNWDIEHEDDDWEESKSNSMIVEKTVHFLSQAVKALKIRKPKKFVDKGQNIVDSETGDSKSTGAVPKRSTASSSSRGDGRQSSKRQRTDDMEIDDEDSEDGNRDGERENIRVNTEPSKSCDKCVKDGLECKEELITLQAEDGLKLGYLEQSPMSVLCRSHNVQLVLKPKNRKANKCSNPLSRLAHTSKDRLAVPTFDNIMDMKRYSHNTCFENYLYTYST